MSTRSRGRKHALGKTRLLEDAPQAAGGEPQRRPSRAQVTAAAFRRQTAMRAPVPEVPAMGTPDVTEPAAQPSFTPAAVAMTGPQPALGRPYVDPGEPPRPLVFEAVAAVIPLPEPMTAEEAARLADGPPPQPADAPGNSVVLYSQEGWTRALSSYRIRTGEWDDWPADVEQGLGRNAAEEATSYRHSRQGIASAWRQTCIGSGHPDWIEQGLRRIHEYVIADREGKERRATDTETFRVLGREVTR